MKKTLIFVILFTLNLTAQVLTNGLVGYYPFNGNANDESGNGNNGQVQGALLVLDRFGKSNSAYYFDGVDDIIRISDPSTGILDFSGSPFSISVWVNTTSSTGGIICKAIGANSAGDYGLEVNNQKLKMGVGYGGGIGGVRHSNGNINSGEWMHIVGVFNTYNSINVYVNGILDNGYSYFSSGVMINSSADLIFGKATNGLGNDFYRGRIDDAYIFNRALSQSEITTLYNEYSNALIEHGGKLYPSVKIGKQIWLKGNMNIGVMLNEASDQTNNSIFEKYCYNNDSNNCNVYGGLYKWDEAMQYTTTAGAQGICPTDWHVMNASDYQTLYSYVNGDGNSLKATGQGSGSGAGTNTSGFSGLLAGWYRRSITYPNFNELTYQGMFWTSSEYNASFVNAMALGRTDAGIGLQAQEKYKGYSVRCIKDELSLAMLVLSSPNRNESKIIGSVDTIKWTSTSVTNVTIELTTNNGTDWSTVVASTPASTGSYVWTVPNTPSAQCKIRISDASDAAVTDASDNVFTISLILQNGLIARYDFEGNANELSGAGRFANLNVNNAAFNTSFKKTGDYSVKFTQNSSQQQWLITPGNHSFNIGQGNTITGWFYWDGGDFWGKSSSNNTVNDKGGLVGQGYSGSGNCTDWGSNFWALTVNSTSKRLEFSLHSNGCNYGGRSLTSNTNSVLANNWYWACVTNDGSGNIKLYLNNELVSSGTNFPTSALFERPLEVGSYSNYYYSGSYPDYDRRWFFSGYIDDIRIYDRELTESERAHIYGSALQSISLISPNGGENKLVGAQDTIKWTSSGVTNIKIELTTNNGTSWSTVVASTPASTGSYVWTVPNTPSTQCKIKISDGANSSTNDTSDNIFTITDEPFSLASNFIFPGTENHHFEPSRWGDYDNDGDLDLLYLYDSLNYNYKIIVLRNNNGTFQNINAGLLGYYDGVEAAWIDYDMDGDLDIITTGAIESSGWQHATRLYKNNNGIFTLVNSGLVNMSGNIIWHDFNGDGTPDLMLNGYIGSGWICKLYLNSSGNFTEVSTSLSGASNMDPSWGDYDNDGDDDLLVCGYSYNNIPKNFTKLFRNDAGQLTEVLSPFYNLDGRGRGGFIDYDNDGDLDVLIGGYYYEVGSMDTCHIHLYQNNNGIFTEVSLPTQNGQLGQIIINYVDYDTDGDWDIQLSRRSWVNGNLKNEVKLFKNNTGVFSEVPSGMDNEYYYFVNGDQDNDGDMDVLVSSQSTKFYRNNVIGNNIFQVNTPPSAPSALNQQIIGNEVVLGWNKATDISTPQNTLTYNLRIGTTPGGSQIKSVLALNSGKRLLVDYGNVQFNNSWRLRDLKPGTYYWTVQSIDNSFSGSQFAPEMSFTISASISLLSPNGGENKLVGAQDTIKWTSSGVANVKIELTTNNGTSWTNIVASTPASTGSYVWTVTNPPSTQCKIKISDASNSAIADTSSGTFKIQTQLQYGLIAYYPFNGNANDESGNGYNGTNHGAISAPDRFDNSGKAFSFNGINQYISVPNIPFGDQNTDKSISVWFKLNSTNPNDYVTPLCQAYGAGLDRWAIDISAQEVNVGIVYDGYTNWGTGLVNSQPISIGTEGYHHLVVVGSNNFPANNKLKIYIDGIYKGSISSLNIKGFPIPVTMQQGTYYSGTAYRTGNLDEIKIFNRILSQSEIDSLYYESGYNSVVYGNKTYHAVTIGTQTWLKENLDIGGRIDGAINQTNNSTIEKYCYNNLPANCDVYGGLYQWDEAMQYSITPGAKGICPDGWHLPTLSDYQILAGAANNSSNALKAIGQGTGSGAGTNSTGFSALLAGNRDNGGFFVTLGTHNYLLSSSQQDANNGALVYLYHTDDIISSQYYSKISAVSVRCLKDVQITSSLQLITPNGGENKLVGVQDTIKWTSTGVTNIKIELTTNNGTNWSTVVASTPASTGSYVWTVPNTPSTQCKIKISDAANAAIADTSNGIFKMQSQLQYGLVASYPFNGNANDESGNGNNGTVNGATLTSDRFGKQNSAYYFNGIDEPIRASNSASLNPNYLSIAAWVYYEGASYNGHIVSKGLDEYDLFVETSVGSGIGGHINNNSIKSNVVLQNNVWRFLCLVKSNDSVSLFQDAIKIKSIPLTGTIMSNSFDLFIGRQPGESNSKFKGKVDDVRIYNRPLSQSEVDSLYYEGGYGSISYGGKTYHTINIGTQTWLKENLDIGNMIEGSQNASNNSIIEKYCFDNTPANCDTYGGFYQWSEAMQYAAGEGSQGICPFGWHIPTQADFQVLINYVNNSSNALLLNASNTSGFSAYLAGMKISSGGFQNLNSAAHFWSSKVGEPGYAYGMYLYQDANIGSGPTIQGHGYNIRCIKNETQNISVVSPNGGENKVVGTQDTIKWTSTGVTNVKIELTTNNGTNWSTVVASAPANTGKYVWTVPNTVSAICRIRISDAANSAIYDTSDVNFKIILPGGLVAYYPFNGNANDESGNGNNGTVNGASLTADRFGNGNKSYNFTNTSDYIQVADGPTFDFTATKQLSVGVWVKLNSASNGYVIDKFGTGGSEDDDFSCNIYNGIIQFSVNGPGVFKGVESNTVLTTGKWYFVLLKWDGINAKQSIYINGIKDAEITTPVLQINNTNTALRIGKPAHPASSIIGLIDDIRIYNRAITQDEVDSLYREGGYNAPPAPPTNLTGISLDKQVRLVWNKSVDSDIRKYKIYRSLNSPATILYDSTAGPNDTTKLFSGLKNGQKYYYAVKAVDSSGQLSDYSNEVAVAPTGLIAWYPFNNNANDTTSNWTPGTINNISYTSDRFGTNGRAAYINGNENSYINIGKIELLSQFTLAGWVKLDPASGTPGSALFSNSNQSAGYEVLHTGSAGGNKWKLTTGTASNITDTAQLMPNRWYYITATYDGINTGKIYINGQLSSSSASITPVLPNSTNTLLGKSAYNSNYLLGAIDDIRIYNRLLTATEVDSLYRERGWTGNDLNLVKPNGGEVIAAGSVYNVTWTATGVTSLKIEFTSDNGSDWNTVAASVNAASGSYQWTVPDINSAQCRIRISDANNSSVSDSSSTLFTIKRIPAAISLAMPENNSINLPLNLTFRWNREAESEKYEFLLGTDSLFQSKIIIVNDTLVSDTFKVVTGVLNYNTKYYWKVRGKNIAGKGVYSPVWNFTTRLASPVLMHPADDTVNVKINPTFIWGAVTGAAAYHLQAGTDSLFITGLVIDQQSLSTNSYAYSGLANNTVYYWRVKAKNSLKESEWSGINNFRTMLASPQLVAPGNNTIGQELTIVFSWQQVPGASHYRIRIASDSLFSNILYNDTSAQLSKTVGNLVPLANHYWQVAAVNQYGMSLYSQFYMFKTKGTAAPVQLVQPAANQLNVTIPVQFVWRKAGDIVVERPKRGNEGTSGKEAINKYWFELTRDTVTGYVNRDTLLTENDTVKTVDTLSYNTVYYWRVKARNEVGWGVFGYWSKFTTIYPVPGTISLVQPADSALNIPLSVTLLWRKEQASDNYHLQVSELPDFSSLMIVNDTNRVDTSYQLSGLQYSKTYYWRVRGKNIRGYGSYSARRFTVKLATVVLAAPVNDSTVNTQIPRLTWFKVTGAQNYHLQVATDTGFTTPFIDNQNLADSFYTMPTLVYGQSYYWRVKARSGQNNGDFSQRRKFTVYYPAPVAPVLIAPDSGSVNHPVQNVLLRWNFVTGTTAYHVQVAKDPAFAQNQIIYNDSTLTGTQRLLPVLGTSTKYYWRVRAKNQGGWGSYSNVWNFSTIVPPPVDLSAVSSNKKVRLSWTMLPDSNITEYRVYRRDNLTGYQMIGNTTTKTYKDTPLVNGRVYFYRIQAVSVSGAISVLSDSIQGSPYNRPPIAVIPEPDKYVPNAGALLLYESSYSSFGSRDQDENEGGALVAKRWYIDNKYYSGEDLINFSVKQGTHYIKLVVEDNDGAMDSVTRTVNVTAFKQYMGGQISAGLSKFQNRFYVFVKGGTNNGFWALDSMGNINLAYSGQIGGEVLSTSSIDTLGNIYLGSTDFKLYGFRNNLTQLWPELNLGSRLSATPTIDDEDPNKRMYIGVEFNRFQSVNRVTGNQVWSMVTDGAVYTSSVIDTSRTVLFFTTAKGVVYGFLNFRTMDTLNPQPKWMFNLGDSISTSPAIDKEGYYYFGSRRGRLYKIQLIKDGPGTVNKVWDISLNAGGAPLPLIASPVIDHFGSVFIGSVNGRFFKVANNGEVLWSVQTQGPITTTAAISYSNKIYVGNSLGEVFAFGTNGDTVLYYKDTSAVCNSILTDYGMVYFANLNGRVIALFDSTDNEDKMLGGRPQWGTFQSDNRRTGGDRTILRNVVSAKEELAVIPDEYLLKQNYPNPFNPTTTIEFGLPDESYVKLKIYNVAGEVIGELVNGYKSAGYHKAAWVTQHLATGVYFYSLEATSADGSKNFKSIKKMLYLK
ncbi:MAG: VCBS repeat-containing protein [Ignavibacteriaceae bacterium]|nr:VCBS repeat-containing protein [Ignavibacteriaceae bacterium]